MDPRKPNSCVRTAAILQAQLDWHREPRPRLALLVIRDKTEAHWGLSRGPGSWSSKWSQVVASGVWRVAGGGLREVRDSTEVVLTRPLIRNPHPQYAIRNETHSLCRTRYAMRVRNTRSAMRLTAVMAQIHNTQYAMRNRGHGGYLNYTQCAIRDAEPWARELPQYTIRNTQFETVGTGATSIR